MYSLFTRLSTWILTFAVVFLGAAGCASKTSYDTYVPSTENARRALETALTAWQNGQAAKTIEGETAHIDPYDLWWKSGKKLDHFEILSVEPTADNGPVWFSVKLTLKGATPQTVRYVVIGKDPLGVYSEEGYKQMAGG
jgi:hypothetical protein